MIRIILYGKDIFRKFSRDEMSVYAAQASFFIILAAFPFFMLLLSLIQMIPYLSEDDLIGILTQIAPSTLTPLLTDIVETIYSGSPVAILSATAVAALWSSSRGMLSIERGLNRVHDVVLTRGYIYRRIVCSGYTIIFSVVCILALLLLVFGEMLQKEILVMLPFLKRLSPGITTGRAIGTILVLTFCFTGLYAYLPAENQTIRSQIPGGILAALSWSVFSYAFSIYFKYFKSYANMYGSLTAMVLLMLWLYFGICILFLGAELNWQLTNRPFHSKKKNRQGDSV